MERRASRIVCAYGCVPLHRRRVMLTLILLLQISLPSLTLSDADLEVEVLEPLKSSIEYQLEEANVRVTLI